MWLMEIKNVPDKVFDHGKSPVPPCDRETLRQRSVYLAAAGEGRELMFVLGIYPPTFLSQTAYLWMLLQEDVIFSLRQLREIKRVLPAFLRLFPYSMRAETCNPTSARFAEFLGGVAAGTAGERKLYEWSI